MKPEILYDLALFVKVVENNSFTKAAKELGISKSMVSKHIMRLESHLSVQLINRSTRKLNLTETGRAMFERSKEIYYDVDELQHTLTSTHARPHGTLRVSSPLSFGHLHLTPAIADFVQQYPDIRVQLLLGRHHEDLIENGLDLAIKIGDLVDSSLIARRLTERPLRVCASPGYVAKYGKPETPQDLLKHNCLRHEHSPTGDEWHFQNKNETVRIKIKGRFSSNSSQALKNAALAGTGIVMLPGYTMTHALKSKQLVDLLQDYCLANIGIHVIYPQSRHLASKVRVFIDFLAERFQDTNYWV